MSNWTHWLTKRISHNPWISLWVALCITVLGYAYGCESKVMYGEQEVTREQLVTIAHQEETSYLTKRADLMSKIESLDLEQKKKGEMLELNFEELDRQDERKAQLLEGVVSIAETYAPAGVVDPFKMVIGTLFPAGLGAFYLNGRRKDKVIEEKSNST